MAIKKRDQIVSFRMDRATVRLFTKSFSPIIGVMSTAQLVRKLLLDYVLGKLLYRHTADKYNNPEVQHTKIPTGNRQPVIGALTSPMRLAYAEAILWHDPFFKEVLRHSGLLKCTTHWGRVYVLRLRSGSVTSPIHRFTDRVVRYLAELGLDAKCLSKNQILRAAQLSYEKDNPPA